MQNYSNLNGYYFENYYKLIIIYGKNCNKLIRKIVINYWNIEKSILKWKIFDKNRLMVKNRRGGGKKSNELYWTKDSRNKRVIFKLQCECEQNAAIECFCSVGSKRNCRKFIKKMTGREKMK